MKIETGNVATIAYDITTAEGEIVESSDISGPIAILVGAQAMIPGLDKRLVGLDVGAEETFEIPPEEAFGTEEDAPTNVVSRAEFPKDAKLEVGQKFQANMPNGTTLTLAIREISDDTVTTAMIHPLAGKTLSVSVKVISVRAATSKETEAGRAMVTPPPPPPPPKK